MTKPNKNKGKKEDYKELFKLIECDEGCLCHVWSTKKNEVGCFRWVPKIWARDTEQEKLFSGLNVKIYKQV